LLHQGRAEYTLITPVPRGPPKVEVKVMGIGPGEHRQLLVGTGVWKRSHILPEDVALGKTEEEKDRIGCLISEVVVPGFHWEDHAFMDRRHLEDLSRGVEGGGEDFIAKFEKHVKKD
jgi:predicted cupin superfamily sugar epimerase